jgi:subtilisin family serine protease
VASPSGYVTDVEYGQSSKEYDFPDGSVAVSTTSNWRSRAHNFEITVLEHEGRPTAASPAWRIRLHGRSVTSGRVDVWIGNDAPGAQFTGLAATPAMTICQPGDASSAITVAAYTTRVEWPTVLGTQRVGFSIDDICDFSSEGPRRDNSEKPDVTAPGAVIASCLSRDSHPDHQSVIDNEHCVMHGTSMACPFVTGIAALLLQRDPGLDPAGLKGMLRSHSAIPGRQHGVFDPKWGYGLVDVSHM